MKDLKIKVIGIGSGGQDAVNYLYLNNKCKKLKQVINTYYPKGIIVTKMNSQDAVEILKSGSKMP